MAYKVLDKIWNPYDQDYICKFILDSVDDLEALPKCAAGSIAEIIDETLKDK